MQVIFQKIRRYGIYTALLLLYSVFAFHAFQFAAQDKMSPSWDDSGYLAEAIKYYAAIIHLNPMAFFAAPFTFIHPPAVEWIYSVYLLLFGFSKVTLIAFSLTLLDILLGSTYWFIQSQVDDTVAGITTIFALGLIVEITRPLYSTGIGIYTFMLDFPTAAITVATFYLILHVIRINKQSPLTALAVGMACALAVMMKETAIIVLVIPLAVYCVTLIKNHKFIALTLLAFAVTMGGLWYVVHFQQIYASWNWLTRRPDQLNPPSLYTSYIWNTIKLSLWWLIPSGAILLYSLFWPNQSTRRHLITAIFTRSLLPYFSIGFSLIIAFILPIRDPRYLYASLFLAGLFIFSDILRRTKGITVYILLCVSILYTAGAIWRFWLIPNTAQPALADVKNFIVTEKPQSVSYFLESTAMTFNYNNILMLYTQLATFQHIDIPLITLNWGNEYDPEFFTCANSTADIMIVYTAPPDTTTTRKVVHISQVCPKKLLSGYRLIQKKKFYDGIVQYYKKISLGG